MTGLEAFVGLLVVSLHWHVQLGASPSACLDGAGIATRLIGKLLVEWHLSPSCMGAYRLIRNYLQVGICMLPIRIPICNLRALRLFGHASAGI